MLVYSLNHKNLLNRPIIIGLYWIYLKCNSVSWCHEYILVGSGVGTIVGHTGWPPTQVGHSLTQDGHPWLATQDGHWPPRLATQDGHTGRSSMLVIQIDHPGWPPRMVIHVGHPDRPPRLATQDGHPGRPPMVGHPGWSSRLTITRMATQDGTVSIIIIILYFENVAFFHAIKARVGQLPQGRQPNLWRHSYPAMGIWASGPTAQHYPSWKYPSHPGMLTKPQPLVGLTSLQSSRCIKVPRHRCEMHFER